MADEVFKLLSAGGDISLITLVFIMWRFDRRILKIEVHIETLFKTLGDITRSLRMQEMTRK